MIKRSRPILPITLFVFGLAALVFGLGFSPSFQSCYGAVDQNHAQKSNPNTDQVFTDAANINRLWRLIRCEATSLDENNGTVTAIATAAIAAFTLVLWLATSRQARLLGETIRPSRSRAPPKMPARPALAKRSRSATG